MTVIRHNSISGIVSITAAAGSNLSFYDSAGGTLSLDTGNINAGVITATTANFTNATVTGDLTVQGTTTTLDTTVTEVDKLEVGANNTTVGVAITQSGTGDILRLYDGASQVVTVKDGGSVGIGTDNPDQTLHLYDSTAFASFTNDDDTGESGILFRRHDNNQNRGKVTYSFTDDALLFRASSDGSGEDLRITSSGKVGIGITNPGQALSIAGNSVGLGIYNTGNNHGNVYFYKDGTAKGWLKYRGDNDTLLIGNVTDSIHVATDGDVAIGGATPVDRLTVYHSNNGNPTGITIRNTEASSTYSHARLRLESQNAAAYADIWADVANSALRLGYNSSSTVNINSSGRITAPERIYVGETYNISNVSGSIAGSGGGQDYIGLRHGTTFGLMLKTAGTNAGNIGIGGITGPGALLHLRDSDTTTQGAAQLKISKGIGAGAAPSSASRANCYIHLGSSEWRTGGGGHYLMGFGYTNGETGTGIPAYVGFVETTSSGYTYGDLIFGTRPNTDGTNNPTERIRITYDGFVNVNDYGNIYNSDGYTNAQLFVYDVRQGGHAGTFVNNHVSYNQANHGVLWSGCSRSASSGYVLFAATSGNGNSLNYGADYEFRLYGDGNGKCDGSWTGGGADYAEMFEWVDGNPDAEDRRGLSVVLEGNKIRTAVAGEDPIGVISANPTILGDASWNKWTEKHLRDDFGSYILQEHNVVEWTDEEGTEHNYEDWNIPADVVVPDDAVITTHDGNGKRFTHRAVNPAYDPDREYIPREERQEWDAVGLMGKLRIRKGQVTGTRWIKMRDISETVEEWLVR